jgi:hypothetical protein
VVRVLARGSAEVIDVLDPKTARVRILYSHRFEGKGKAKSIPVENIARPVIVPRGLCEMNENGKHTLNWRMLLRLAPIATWIRDHYFGRPRNWPFPKHRPSKDHQARASIQDTSPAQAAEELGRIIKDPATLDDPGVLEKAAQWEHQQLIQAKPAPRKPKWTGQKWGTWWRPLTAETVRFHRLGQLRKWELGEWWHDPLPDWGGLVVSWRGPVSRWYDVAFPAEEMPWMALEVARRQWPDNIEAQSLATNIPLEVLRANAA